MDRGLTLFEYELILFACEIAKKITTRSSFKLY